ncbi:unnamed protein product, partial [Hymenolepis diminuta]
MKKFGGLFAAEGMLDCFQIEICDSLENPLQKVATSPTNSCVITSARRLKSFNTSKFNASGHSTSGSTQRALMCHRFSTKITLMDVVLFGKQECETSRLGDIELRSTTTKIIADLHVDSISQHSNMPLFRLTHQFVTMFYCAQDAQKSADRRRNLILAKPAPFDAKGSVTDTVETGSTLKSRPDYTRLSGHSQDSTIDSTVYQPFSNLEANVGGSASIPIPRREGTVSQNVRSSSFESPREASYGKTPGSSTETQGGGLFSGLPSASVPNAATFTTIPQNTPVMPECWRRMLRYIDLYSTVPETKNVVKKEPAKEESGVHNGAASGVAGLIANAAPHFSFMAAARHDPAVDMETGLLGRPSVDASFDSVTAGAEANASGLTSVFCRRSERTSSAWFKTSERIPTVVLVTMRVRQMTVSAVLSEVNLTAVVRGIHGSFSKKNRVRGHSLFKEKSSNYSFSGHFGDGEIRLTEGIGKFAQEVACMRVDHSHVLLSCARSSRHGERNACTIGLGRVEITVPHHPVRLHGMVQRQARHLSTTVSEFLQIPTNTSVSPSASFRKKTFTDGGLTPAPEDLNLRSGAEERHLSNTATPGAPLIINVTAIARGLTVNVCLHPSLNAVYTMDPVYFFGRIGCNGYLDVTVNTHSLSFQSVHLPIMFPRAVSLSLPKILASLTRRQSLSRHCIVPQGLAAKEGSYLDAQVSVGFFEQRLPSDRLNYIMVVVKLFMK